MHEHELRLVWLAVRSLSAVQGYVHGPLAEVGLAYAPAYHALKLHRELECHIVYIVGVGEDDVLA